MSIKIRKTQFKKLVAVFAILTVVVGGAGGYILWRLQQEEGVGEERSAAGYDNKESCEAAGFTWCGSITCPDGEWYGEGCWTGGDCASREREACQGHQGGGGGLQCVQHTCYGDYNCREGETCGNCDDNLPCTCECSDGSTHQISAGSTCQCGSSDDGNCHPKDSSDAYGCSNVKCMYPAATYCMPTSTGSNVGTCQCIDVNIQATMSGGCHGEGDVVCGNPPACPAGYVPCSPGEDGCAEQGTYRCECGSCHNPTYKKYYCKKVNVLEKVNVSGRVVCRDSSGEYSVSGIRVFVYDGGTRQYEALTNDQGYFALNDKIPEGHCVAARITDESFGGTSGTRLSNGFSYFAMGNPEAVNCSSICDGNCCGTDTTCGHNDTSYECCTINGDKSNFNFVFHTCSEENTCERLQLSSPNTNSEYSIGDEVVISGSFDDNDGLNRIEVSVVENNALYGCILRSDGNNDCDDVFSAVTLTSSSDTHWDWSVHFTIPADEIYTINVSAWDGEGLTSDACQASVSIRSNTSTRCGDGICNDSSEMCEVLDADNNSLPGAGYACADNTPNENDVDGNPSDSTSVQNCRADCTWCGDGIVQDEYEECDPNVPEGDNDYIANCREDCTLPAEIIVTKDGPGCVERVSPNNIATFTITVVNNTATEETITQIVDVLPQGFSYISGSTTIDGASASDPSISQTGTTATLTWEGPWTLQANGGRLVLTFRTQAGESAVTGNNTNRVTVEVEDGDAVYDDYTFPVAISCVPDTAVISPMTVLMVGSGVGMLLYAWQVKNGNITISLPKFKFASSLSNSGQLLIMRITNPRKYYENKIINASRKKKRK